MVLDLCCWWIGWLMMICGSVGLLICFWSLKWLLFSLIVLFGFFMLVVKCSCFSVCVWCWFCYVSNLGVEVIVKLGFKWIIVVVLLVWCCCGLLGCFGVCIVVWSLDVYRSWVFGSCGCWWKWWCIVWCVYVFWLFLLIDGLVCCVEFVCWFIGRWCGSSFFRCSCICFWECFCVYFGVWLRMF